MGLFLRSICWLSYVKLRDPEPTTTEALGTSTTSTTSTVAVTPLSVEGTGETSPKRGRLRSGSASSSSQSLSQSQSQATETNSRRNNRNRNKNSDTSSSSSGGEEEIVGRRGTGAVICDCLAIAIALDPSMIKKSARVHVDVETNGTFTRGQTVVDFGHSYDMDPRDRNVQWLTDVDQEKYIRRFKMMF